MKSLFSLIAIIAFTISIKAQSITEYNLPPAPIYSCGDAPNKLNQVLYGAIPPNSSNKPVVVFVHGWFDNGYSWFIAKNQWYQNCYQEGFRTAFCFQSKSGSFQDNGKIVADMLRKIIKKYNTTNIVIVAHSKGGFDTEWALYNYGMHDSINGVITIGSPFYGAPIVDFIANPIVRLVTENLPIIGEIFRGAGTLQMQPAYVAGVARQMLDNHPQNNPKKFRCFAAYNPSHLTELPNNIPDDFLNIIFYDYNPLCIDLPLGKIGGGLMTLGMSITGLITQMISVPDIYQNPQKNTKDNDGLAPYFSSIRPGSVDISGRNNSLSSINHIDELFSKYMWDIVKENVYYFNEHPQNKNSNLNSNNQRIIAQDETITSSPILSNMQFIQDKEVNFSIDKNSAAQLFLIGNYSNAALKIKNNKNEIVQETTVDNNAKSFGEVFKNIDINQLKEGEYTLESNQKINAILVDDSKEQIALNINKNNELEVQLVNWTDNPDNIKIDIIANRNIDEKGNVIWDKSIPIQLKQNNFNGSYSAQLQLEKDGVYNISAYVKSAKTQRFATTSFYYSNEKTISKNQDILIYPNPVNGEFTVEWQNENATKNNLQIFDMQGKSIYSTTIDPAEYFNNITLDTKTLGLQNGIYLININGKSEKLLVQ